MPFVKCSVDGCNARLQPLLKPDPGNREDWVYPECDVCFRPVCAKRAAEEEGRIICDRCRRAQTAREGEGLIQISVRARRSTLSLAGAQRGAVRGSPWNRRLMKRQSYLA